jgi:hypothetical protein
MFIRNQTDPALARVPVARGSPTLPLQTETGNLQAWYPADLPWEDIEQYLQRKWPHWTNFNPTLVTKALQHYAHCSLTTIFRAKDFGGLGCLRGLRWLVNESSALTGLTFARRTGMRYENWEKCRGQDVNIR